MAFDRRQLHLGLILSLALVACLPTRDLDKAGAGNALGGKNSVAGGTAKGGATSNQGGSGNSTDKVTEGGTGSLGTIEAKGGASDTSSISASGGAVVSAGGSQASALSSPPHSGGADTMQAGRAGRGGATSSSAGTTTGSPGAGNAGLGGSGATAGGGVTPVAQSGGVAGVATTDTIPGGGVPSTTRTKIPGGGASVGGKSNRAGSPGIAPDLPNNIVNTPLTGEIRIEPGNWVINNVQAPTYEIQTPVARYRLLQDVGAIISINDSAQRQWIDYSDSRATRGLPALKACCETGLAGAEGSPKVTTAVDDASRTTTHIRLTSKSADGSIFIVWDFYLTHVTITINRLATPYGFTYRGVPGGYLEVPDVVRYPPAMSKDATNQFETELPGPQEWVYFADPDEGQSLYLIRHGDDDKNESYLVVGPVGGRSAQFTFSGGQDTVLPQRFSVGLVDSTDDAKVTARVKFVIDAIGDL